MKKHTLFPLLLAALLLQACGNSADTAASNTAAKVTTKSHKQLADNKPLNNFLTLYTEYCDSSYSSPEDLVDALQKDKSFKVNDNYDGIFEKSIDSLSYAVSPETDGCTTDVKLKAQASGKPYFDFDEINTALLSKGYKPKGKKEIRTELGLDNRELKVIEQQYITKDNNISTLVFPIEHQDQYYMTLFVEKFASEMQDASLADEEEGLIEI